MRTLITAITLQAALTLISSAQVLYEEHFTNGQTALTWHVGFPDSAGGGNNMVVENSPGNPYGDNWIGKVGNDLSGGSVGMTYAGAATLTDYTMHAWVYTTVTSTSGGPYNSLVFRVNPTTLSYYQFDADFDTDQRLRFRKTISASPTVLQQWVGNQIPGGVPTSTSWHRMSVRMQGNQFWLYWDGTLLPNCPVTDATSPFTNGYFGVYIFQMTNPNTFTRVDDIVVTNGMISISLAPVNPPIQIPAPGGSFQYSINIQNGSSTALNIDAWTMFKLLPNGPWTGPYLNANRTLAAGSNPTRMMTMTIAGSLAPGTYLFEGRIGDYPNNIWSSSNFTFVKLATGAGPWINDFESIGDAFSEELSADATIAPSNFAVTGFYPNPFNPTTALSYKLQAASHVSVRVYDTAGRLVTTLVDGWRDAGNQQVTFDASGLPAGLYIYRLEAGENTACGKLVLMK